MKHLKTFESFVNNDNTNEATTNDSVEDLVESDAVDDYNSLVDEYESLVTDAKKDLEQSLKNIKRKYKPKTKRFDKLGLEPVSTGSDMWGELVYRLQTLLDDLY